ncbi:cytochrome P450 [Roridomyces roridus]|uniref:Cytochrome P450 n=1 Tax=Roridomyces roridus TaxID=1738132 RepID=A0AAD7CCU3_9AGAR|nr:cytochrome P450 [Roridomyces roridus]
MPLQLEDTKPLVYGAAALVAVLALRRTLSSNLQDESGIPTVDSSSFPSVVSTYRDGWRFLSHAAELIQRGYDTYGDRGVFRIARPWHWEYVVCSPNLISEMGSAPDNALSTGKAIELRLQSKFTMGLEGTDNSYHHTVIRTTLTRNLHRCFPDVRDEIVCAFDDVLDLNGSDWKNVIVLPAMMSIVARVSNRLFVGLPLCRDQGYLTNNIVYTLDVFRSADRINMFPPFLRPIVGPFISKKTQSFNKAMEYLGPIIEERLAKDSELGRDYEGRPNDVISWLLDIAEGEERAVPALVLRILITNMAAIHTSSMTVSQTLFDLAFHPEYLQPLREEVETVLNAEGWSKAALNNMVKLDSFMRESQRMRPLNIVSLARMVVSKDGFRFSEGSFLPYGSYVAAASRSTHFDPANYDNPTTFDGFRFSREREYKQQQHVESTDDGVTTDIFKRHMVSTAVDHLPFGNGKHACPGRFFAVTELKAMVAHLVLNYDVKAEVEGVRPADRIFGTTQTPNPSGRMCIRKRQ